MNRHRTTTLAIGIAISAALLWIALRGATLSEVGDALSGANYWVVAPFTASMLVFYWVRTCRWKVLLSPVSKVSARRLFGPVMIGYGANFLLPFQLGEIARSAAARERTGLAFMPIAFSIIVERIFDILVILMALAVALALHPELPGYIAKAGTVTGLLIVAVIGAALAFAWLTDEVLKVVAAVMRFLPEKLRSHVLDQLRSGASGLQSLQDGRRLVMAAAVSVIQWSFILLCIWLSLYAVHVSVSLPTAMLILALIVLSSTVPNAPGYVGSIQAGYVVALEVTGDDPSRGVAASVFYHVIYAVTAVSLGMVALGSAHFKLREVATRADAGG